MAAELYDDVLFEGATFADLQKRAGPLIMATATDISTGSRLGFTQTESRPHLLPTCRACRSSRAAAASSAVPPFCRR